MSNTKTKTKTLALCIIAKNEAAGLERAILSCRSFADQILVSVDSKSTDDTQKIAEKYADVVIKHEWNNNFSELRNNLQAEAKTDWVLCLDGHEYVSQCENIQEQLEQKCDGLFVEIELEGGFKFFFPRLIRTHIKWEHSVHNTPMTKTNLTFKKFLIVHDRPQTQEKGAREDREKQRTNMIEGMLGNLAKGNKKDPRAHFYLGNQYLDSQNWKQALHHYKKHLKTCTNKYERWIVCHNIALGHLALEQAWRALWFCIKADHCEKARWEIFQLAGVACMQLERWEKAADYLVKTLDPPKQIYSTNPIKRNGAATWDMLGMCFSKLNKSEEAKTAWKQSLAANEKSGGHLLSKEKVMIFKSLTESPEDKIKATQTIALCLVVYSRPQRMPEILEQLKTQNLEQFKLYIWNQSGKNLDLSNFPPEKVSIVNSKENIGSCARFKLAKQTTEDIIIFFDDDEDLHPDFVQYNYKKHLEHGADTICGWFTRTFTSNDYWRAKITAPPDVEVDYVGTGGMVLNRKIIDEEKSLQDIPEEFRKVEDLYLCWLAREKYKMRLISIAKKCDIIQDEEDQYKLLMGYKQIAFDSLRKKGWRLLLDTHK